MPKRQQVALIASYQEVGAARGFDCQWIVIVRVWRDQWCESFILRCSGIVEAVG